MIKKALTYLLAWIPTAVGLVSAGLLMSRDFDKMHLSIQLLILLATVAFLTKPAVDYWVDKIKSLMNKED
jgi:membrane protein DedA with SNARE-associated domain